MKKYDLIISKQVDEDIAQIVKRKKEFGTYQSNINEFLEEIDSCYERLETSPYTGSNLSARVRRKTDKKYFVIEDYLMIYRVSEDTVNVMRVLSAKSNWQRMLFK